LPFYLLIAVLIMLSASELLNERLRVQGKS